MQSQTRPRPETLQAALSPAKRTWYVYDAQGKVVGRVASRVARILMGKHRPTYAPHVDNGDCVVVLNAGAARFTGKKLDQKAYYWNTGYPGGLRSERVAEVMRSRPERVLTLAVQRMMPKTRLGERMMKKLKVYAGAAHPHDPKSLVPLELS